MRRIIYLVLILIGLNISFAQNVLSNPLCLSTYAETKPNLLIIHTDEHNFRTLGCYRKTLSEEEAFMWGTNTIVETPHLDALAERGVLCESFYATSPVCTPSRASLVSGLYPINTGSPKNDYPMNDDVVTFASILKKNGYATSYVGKWHLDGEDKPGFAPARNFGFTDNRYMINRGHWKLLQDTQNGVDIIGSWDAEKEKYTYDINDATSESFTTDFLFDKAIEIIERDKGEPFCLMLSIPDPHDPNQVRKPYDTMFTGMQFETPFSMLRVLVEKPNWIVSGDNSISEIPQDAFAEYYGMVKCIDDNVGRLMEFLEQKELKENTIVIFTSDHGDLMGEHAQKNKGLPFEASASIPFIMAYPGHTQPGKVLSKAYTVADFTPTILSLMGINYTETQFEGQDVAADFISEQTPDNEDRIVYITNAASRWVAAVNKRYKLVLSPNDRPYLFDLEVDPHEVENFYNHPNYKSIADTLKQELIRLMQLHNEPLYSAGTIIYDYTPCEDNDNPISNPGFECLLDFWDASSVTIDFEDASEGSSSALFVKSYIRQTIPVKPNTDCSISFDYKYTDLGEGVSTNSFIIFEDDTRETEIGKVTLSPDSTTWTHAQIDFNSGDNDSLFIQLARWNSTSKGLLHVDNFQFESDSVSTSFRPNQKQIKSGKSYVTEDHLNIVAPENILKIEVYNLNGGLMISKFTNDKYIRIGKQHLKQSGIYMVKLNFEGRSEVHKIVLHQ